MNSNILKRAALPILTALLVAGAIWAVVGPGIAQSTTHTLLQAANYQSAAQPPQATPPKGKTTDMTPKSADQIVEDTRNMAVNEKATYVVDYGQADHVSFRLNLIGRLNAESFQYSIDAFTTGGDETLTILRIK